MHENPGSIYNKRNIVILITLFLILSAITVGIFLKPKDVESPDADNIQTDIINVMIPRDEGGNKPDLLNDTISGMENEIIKRTAGYSSIEKFLADTEDRIEKSKRPDYKAVKLTPEDADFIDRTLILSEKGRQDEMLPKADLKKDLSVFGMLLLENRDIRLWPAGVVKTLNVLEKNYNTRELLWSYLNFGVILNRIAFLGQDKWRYRDYAQRIFRYIDGCPYPEAGQFNFEARLYLGGIYLSEKKDKLAEETILSLPANQNSSEEEEVKKAMALATIYIVESEYEKALLKIDEAIKYPQVKDRIKEMEMIRKHLVQKIKMQKSASWKKKHFSR